ncbi:shieldin complex subunit 3 [Brachyhypopomus gauderio]|uniref:shieldin complex subunit 3 n=1 Tax=Brachyhypopomus gauderio TaxID=698409 RepID=UPI0040418BDB
MDVFLHYKHDQDKLNDLVFLTERTLQDFPCGVLKVFTPWFPSGAHSSLPLKPKKAPPVISSKQLRDSEFLHQSPDFDSSTRHRAGEETFQQDDKRTFVRSSGEDVPKRCRRSWSVFSHKTKTTAATRSFSRQFHKTIQTFGLHWHQRAKWIICEVNCVPRSIEEIWWKLDHAIKHSRLPTCNANFQRNMVQIWVYCDIFYCEYVGHFLRQKLHLAGEIVLAVHKLGNIFKL